MKDFSLLVEEGESLQVFFTQGKVSKSVFLWFKKEDEFSISVSTNDGVDEEEEHVVKVLSSGKILTTKQ